MEAILSFIPVPVAVILMAAGFVSLAVGGIRLGYKATVKNLALDLVNVRLLLEPGMAEMAALNASDEDIERIQRLCDRVESKIHSGDLYIEDDIAFHTCIAESSKNMVVEQLIPIIDTAVMMFVNVTHKKLTEETILTHRMITEAIARHDPIGARSAMVMHLNFNRNCIRKLYDGEWET